MVKTDSLRGLSEAALIERLGQPSSTVDGFYGSKMASAEQNSLPVKTHFFQLSQGTMFATLEQRGSEWIVIANDWLPVGPML
jgi:hypothetical protein